MWLLFTVCTDVLPLWLPARLLITPPNVHNASTLFMKLRAAKSQQCCRSSPSAAPLASSSLLYSGIFHFTIMTTPTQQSVTWRRRKPLSEPLRDRQRQDGVFTVSRPISALQLFNLKSPPPPAIPSSSLTLHIFSLSLSVSILVSPSLISGSVYISLLSLFQIFVLLFKLLPCHMLYFFPPTLSIPCHATVSISGETHLCSINVCTDIFTQHFKKDFELKSVFHFPGANNQPMFFSDYFYVRRRSELPPCAFAHQSCLYRLMQYSDW